MGVLLNLKWTNLKLLLFLLTTTLAGPVVAQKLIAGKVPAEVKESFKKEFPAVTDVKWEMEKKSVYEASFKMDGKSMSANFSEKGEWQETETDVKVAELPKAATDYIAQHYKGAKIREAAMIKKPGGITRYEAEVNGKDLIFDEKGNFVAE